MTQKDKSETTINNHENDTSFRDASSFTAYLKQSDVYNTEDDVIEFSHLLVGDVRAWIQKKGWDKAEALMDRTIDLQNGFECTGEQQANTKPFRNDDKTPKILHAMTANIWLIAALEHGISVEKPEDAMATLWIHDNGEEYDETQETLGAFLKGKGFDDPKDVEPLQQALFVMSKEGAIRYGERLKRKPYLAGVFNDQLASCAKPPDRPHNVMTSVGVNNDEKVKRYAKNSKEHIDGMRNISSKKFPENSGFYALMSDVLEQQIQMIEDHYDDITDLPPNNELINRIPAFKDLPHGLHPLVFMADRLRELHADHEYDMDDLTKDTNTLLAEF